MRNRVLQVKMVKNENKNAAPQTDQTDSHFEGKTAIIGAHLLAAVEKIGKGVIVYVLVDTVRQVAVARASK